MTDGSSLLAVLVSAAASVAGRVPARVADAHALAGRGLVPPVNSQELPALPEVEFISLAAGRLSEPAETLLTLLRKSDLRASRMD